MADENEEVRLCDLTEMREEFYDDDVVVVDSKLHNTAKMPAKDRLPQNILAGRIAPKFVPNETEAKAGQTYMYGGNIVIAKEDYKGPMYADKFYATSVSEILKSSLLQKVEEELTTTVTQVNRTSIRMKAGVKYIIYIKSTTEVSKSFDFPILYEMPIGCSAIEIVKKTAAELYAGVTVVYTATADSILGVRTYAVGTVVNVSVTYNMRCVDAADFDVFKDAQEALNETYESYDEKFDASTKVTKEAEVTTTATTPNETGIKLFKGVEYSIYVKSTTLVSQQYDFPILYEYYVGSGNEVIVQKTAADLYAGFTVNFTPTKDGTLRVRTYAVGTVVNVSVTYNMRCVDSADFDIMWVGEINKVANQLKGKKWTCYGDSITAISNGDGLSLGWAKYVNEIVPFGAFCGRGVGGQKFAYGTSGCSATILNATTGEYVTRDDNYNKDNYPGSVPAGQVLVRGAFCSWDRIIHMYPASIKDTIDVVCIMGGSNDAADDTDAVFINSDTTDPEWAASGADYYGKYGGDFNITTLKGGVASTIMKFQAWMPNAVIIVCTPFSGRGTGTSISTNIYTEEYDKSKYIKEIAARTSCPCIDVNGTCGVSPFNRNLYLSDSVHPYNEPGKKMLARAFIMGFRTIEPLL